MSGPPDTKRDTAQAADDDAPVSYERRGGVALVTYRRPERRNAWSIAAVRATIAAIERANTDDRIGAIVLTGLGAVFCAGTDLKEPPVRDPQTGRRITPADFTMGSGDRNWIGLLTRSKPLVVAINGPAVGIGATQTLAADIRLAADTASFSFPFLSLGAMPECGSTALLPRLIGLSRATDILLRGATVSAEEARQIGLVSATFPADRLLPEALALAERIAALPALQLRITKRMLHENAGNHDADRIMRVESDGFIELLKAAKRDRALDPARPRRD
ncbi:enoyl-CoA hydratase/isomerase family protein [Sphingomonas flavalba]|uniref:enoyl-CoA hydratase/isomerase family protein n=1 Tax=Sphingomonas flavalba TaxID=2559804 RepID=UPI0039E0FBF8